MPRYPIVVLIALAAAVLIAALEGDSPAFGDFMREALS